jgi:hypothetical protein
VEAWSHNFVYNNHIYDIYPPNTGLGWGNGLYVNNNNLVTNNKVRDNQRYGIKVGSDNNTICDNDVWDNSRNSTGTYDGIYVTSSYNIINNNRCYDDLYSGVRNQRYGICISATGHYNVVTGNEVTGNKNGGMLISGTDNKVTHNIGFATENSGTANIITTNTVTFDHGLAGTPTHVECGFKTIGYGTWKWSATSTQITITVENSGTYTFSWYAEYKP